MNTRRTTDSDYNRTDLSVAIVLSSKPRFSNQSGNSPLLASSLLSPLHRFQTRIQDDDAPHDLHSTANAEPLLVENVFAELRYLYKIKESAQPEDTQIMDGVSYSDRVYSLGQSLIYQSDAIHSGNLLLEGCCRSAGLIYIHASLCDVSFESRAIEALVDQLKRYMEQMLLEIGFPSLEDSELQRNKAFWSLVVGCIASKGKTHFSWFRDVLRMSCTSLGLNNIVDAKRSLESILWDSKLEAQYQLIYNEI
jgi:hypothetical protein